MLQDLRVALRSLGKSPAFAAVVVLTLGLGIGSITAVFSVVNGALLASLPFEGPERLMLVKGTWREGSNLVPSLVSYPDFDDYRRQADVFTAFAAYSEELEHFVLRLDGKGEQITGEFVSRDYFEVLGLRPARGRFFAPEEDQPPAGARVAILSHDAWISRFGGDSAILDQTVLVSDEGFQIVGIAPRGFRGLTDAAEIFLPVTSSAIILGPDNVEERSTRWLAGVGRLREGVSAEQARSTLENAAGSLAQRYPDTNEQAGITALPLLEVFQGSLRKGLLTLLLAAGFVLLIGCVNIANLLLTRAMARQGEIAVRTALGASRGQLIRQVLAESLVLAAMGCATGLLLALWATRMLVSVSGVTFRHSVEIGLDPLVVVAALGASVLAGLGFGLLPALSASRVDLNETLKQGGKSSASFGRQRLQSALVIAEVALALLLFVSAGLMIRSFVNLQAVDLGFRPDNLLTFRLDVKGKSFENFTAQSNLMLQLLDRMRAVPGVKSVAASSPDLPTDDFLAAYVALEEREDSVVNDQVTLEFHRVSPDYFSTLGIPMAQGRSFSSSDAIPGQPVAVASESVVRHYWGGSQGLGRRLKMVHRTASLPWFQVVGVAGDVLHAGLRDDGRKRHDVYVPILQMGFGTRGRANFLVRVENGVDPVSLSSRLREEVQAVTTDLPMFDIATLQERLDHQVTRDRFLVFLMTLFAIMALVLAAVGIYGVISYAVTQRAKEIGVRMALGADRGEVLKLVVRRGVLLTAAGVGLGLVGSLALTRLLKSLLYGVGALDPLTLGSTALFLILVALVASYLPARRATRIEPSVTLRAD